MHYTSVPCSKALQIWSLTANYSCLLCQISAYNRQLGVCLHSSLCFTNFLILITFNFTFSNWRGKETQKRLTHNVFSTFSSLKLDSWTFTKVVKYWYCRVYWGVHLETTTTKKKQPVWIWQISQSLLKMCVSKVKNVLSQYMIFPIRWCSRTDLVGISFSVEIFFATLRKNLLHKLKLDGHFRQSQKCYWICFPFSGK